MLTRRKLIMGAVATALVGLGATPALARDERLLADILYGVSDALVRDYIRDRYEDGRWDGHYWYYGGHRYTPHEYGRYWAEEYHRQPPKKPKKRKKPHPHPRDWDDDDDDDDDRRRPHHRPPPPPCPPGRRSLKRPMRKRMTRSLAKIRTTKRNLRRGPSMTTTPTRTAT